MQHSEKSQKTVIFIYSPPWEPAISQEGLLPCSQEKATAHDNQPHEVGDTARMEKAHEGSASTANKQSRTDNKGWSSSLRIGRMANNSVQKQQRNVT
jgi:hypothetical protein